MASRLSLALPSLISGHQAAFIKGRPIHHQIAMAHELFQNLNSKIRGGSICLKLDITKAFDKLNLEYHFSTLKFFKFGGAWISLIKEWVCATRGSVLVNRIPQGFFGASCGLRQGDPLSPLFILAEELLSLHLQNLQSKRVIFPVSLIPYTPCHLLYADDILLFPRASKPSLLAIKNLLFKYQNLARQIFYMQTSQLHIGKHDRFHPQYSCCW